jgi:hypothetical protein
MADKKADGTETLESTEPVVNQTEESTAVTQEPVTIPNTEIAKTTETAIVFKATKPLMKEEFELLSNMVKYENEKTGLKIVLMPFSCEITQA